MMILYKHSKLIKFSIKINQLLPVVVVVVDFDVSKDDEMVVESMEVESRMVDALIGLMRDLNVHHYLMNVLYKLDFHLLIQFHLRDLLNVPKYAMNENFQLESMRLWKSR